MQTIRQRMVAILSKGPRDARDLSQALGVRVKEIYAHLPHIRRSLASTGRQLSMEPAECLSCGYVFKKRTRYTRPARCVRCKNERITEPKYRVL